MSSSALPSDLTGRVFSAGLDFDYHLPLFARRSTKAIDAWFEAYRATNLRIFTYPRPTVRRSISISPASRTLIATISKPTDGAEAWITAN